MSLSGPHCKRCPRFLQGCRAQECHKGYAGGPGVLMAKSGPSLLMLPSCGSKQEGVDSSSPSLSSCTAAHTQAGFKRAMLHSWALCSRALLLLFHSCKAFEEQSR